MTRPKELRVAVVQLCSTENIQDNLENCMRLIRLAQAAGASFIALPENCLWLSPNSMKEGPVLFPDSPELSSLRELAKELKVSILIGSLPEASSDPQKFYNTSVLLNERGDVVATYRKIFLFDITLGAAENHKESDRIAAGTQISLTQACNVPTGLSICYDLRFPEMYRALVAAGAQILTVPAAFTSTTGRDHWEPLLRARAIENQCFVIAPGQWGHHGGKRRSHGRSMILSPWGTLLAQVEDGVGFAVTTLDFISLDQMRRSLPCLQHRRDTLFH